MTTNENLIPVGTKVKLQISRIGGFSESVTGIVTGYSRRGNQNVVLTDSGHGEVVVSTDEAEIVSDNFIISYCETCGAETPEDNQNYEGICFNCVGECVHCAEAVYVEETVGLVCRAEGGTYDFCEVSRDHKHQI